MFPYISRIHTAYTGEYLHFWYLKWLVLLCKTIGGGSVNLRKDWWFQRFELFFTPKGKTIQFDEHIAHRVEPTN